jgi:glycosyltransferase involved in cell wall biosynthesis
VKPPLFSVIVPAFNACATLPVTVASVLGQSCGDYELLLVDDGSTDDTRAVMLRLARIDARIRVISHPNQGVAASRNTAAAGARGALLAFLDADDVWHDNKLAVHRRFHEERPDVDISFAQIAFVRDHGSQDPPSTYSTVPHGRVTLGQLLAVNPACTASNVVVTRQCFARVGGFVPGMSHAEDQEWLVRAAASGAFVAGIDRLLVDYRMSADGLSADLDRMLAGWRALSEPYAGDVDLRAAEAKFYRYLSRRALRTGAGRSIPLRYAAAGLRQAPTAFFAEPRRAALTLGGAIASLFLPTVLRRRLFA